MCTGLLLTGIGPEWEIDHRLLKEEKMSQIYNILIITVIVCVSGCVSSDREKSPAVAVTQTAAADESPVVIEELSAASEKLLSVWDESVWNKIKEGTRADYIRDLISEGADVNARYNDGWTPLMRTVFIKSPEIPSVVTVLIDLGADVNAKNNSGTRPLELAVIQKQAEIVKLLIKAGADVDARAKIFTPIMHAVFDRNIEIVKLLIEAGADVNAKTDSSEELTPLMCAVMASSSEIVTLLIEAGANVNICSNESTALTMAVEKPAIVKLLIEAGADVNFSDGVGRTPLTYAQSKDSAEVIDLLKAAGAKE